jgi:Fic-DOC domain mobile mystery protein B
MRTDNLITRDGSTPLDPDQIKGIRFSHLTNMGELDELEDLNIQKGLEWLQHQKNGDYLRTEFLCRLHEKLFGDVWKWAGKFRTVEVNISKYRAYDIGPQLLNFFEDLKLWLKSANMTSEEISAEMHHRLVCIHPFPNGNGRTTRIYTEYFQRRQNWPVTNWKASLSTTPQERRKSYIKALQLADKGDFRMLIEFMSEKNRASKEALF